MPQPSVGRLQSAFAALPTGTVPVGIGLAVAALSAYGFQIIAFRALGAEPYAALNGLWVTAFVLAPGLFLPLEQEVARALAHRHSLGQGGRPLIKRAAMLGALLTICVVGLVVLLRGPIENRLLRDSDELFVALIVVLVGFAVESLCRGILSGNGRFGRYGLIVGADGFARVGLAALLATVGATTLGWFGAVFAVAPFIASLAGVVRLRGLNQPGPAAPTSELSTAIGWLLLGSTFSQALSYSAYIGASVLATKSQDAELGAFIAGLFIARIPLLLFQALQAALLPKLASLLGKAKFVDFRIGLIRLAIGVAALGLFSVVIALVAGPFIGMMLFGAKFSLTGASLAALTAGCSLMMLALAVAQALIALRCYARTALAWVVAMAVFVIAILFIPAGGFVRAEVAFVMAAAVAALWMFGAVLNPLRRLSSQR
jgi:O-antigen/teichoic acid export membrane protein